MRKSWSKPYVKQWKHFLDDWPSTGPNLNLQRRSKITTVSTQKKLETFSRSKEPNYGSWLLKCKWLLALKWTVFLCTFLSLSLLHSATAFEIIFVVQLLLHSLHIFYGVFILKTVTFALCLFVVVVVVVFLFLLRKSSARKA